MSYFETHPATETSPAEHASSCIVRCASCGQPWDEDADAAEFEMLDGSAYCKHRDATRARACYLVTRDAAYKREVVAEMTRLLDEMDEEIARLDTRYDSAGESFGEELEIVADARERLQRFAGVAEGGK